MNVSGLPLCSWSVHDPKQLLWAMGVAQGPDLGDFQVDLTKKDPAHPAPRESLMDQVRDQIDAKMTQYGKWTPWIGGGAVALGLVILLNKL